MEIEENLPALKNQTFEVMFVHICMRQLHLQSYIFLDT